MEFLPSNNKWLKLSGLSALALSSGLALAQAPAQCQKINFTDPGWSDIGVTNAVARTLLDGMGYQTEVFLLSVPVGFESIKNGKIDVFMGNWMPAQSAFMKKYKDDLSVVRTNLDGVKFTLAVPQYAYDAGVHDFADLKKFSKQFHSRIYGIAAGSPANLNIQKMINTNDFGLKDWKLVESGEQAMLSQVARSVKRDKFIVFLAWEPHPMNVNFHIKYLSGGDKYFGPNYGSASIHTVTRKGFSDDCPNVGKLLSNLKFSVGMENEMIAATNNKGEKPDQAVKEWIKAHPSVLNDWLQGVSTFQGQPALPAVKAKLGL